MCKGRREDSLVRPDSVVEIRQTRKYCSWKCDGLTLDVADRDTSSYRSPTSHIFSTCDNHLIIQLEYWEYTLESQYRLSNCQ
jgi:hypothetical protein